MQISQAENIIKELYLDDVVEDLISDSRPVLSALKKFEKNVGEDLPVVPLYGRPQAVNVVFSAAQAAAANTSSKYGRFKVTGRTKQAVATVDGETLARVSGEGGFVKPLSAEIDNTIKALSDRGAIELFTSGWGEIGVIASISGATITFVRTSDVLRCEIDQVHNFSATLNASGLRNSGGTTGLTVISVDAVAGSVTYNANVSTVTGTSVGDYVFFQGDRQDSSSPSMLSMAGFEAWIPPFGYNFSGDSFFGQDRSVYPTRLAGNRYDGSTGEALEDVMQNADAIVSAAGGKLDHLVVSNKRFAQISNNLGSRVRYQPVRSGNIGFGSLMVTGQAGDITILADRFCPSDRMYGLQMDTWELASAGKFVKINNDDGQTILRQPSNDGVEVRMVSRWAQLICRAPAFNINIKLDSN